MIHLGDKMEAQMVGAAMAKPKRKAKLAAKQETKTIGLRATLEWAEWIERGAKFCRTDVAKLIDNAVVDYLKGRGFPEEAPERMP